MQIKYIDTKNQLADILTKGNFTRGTLWHKESDQHPVNLKIASPDVAGMAGSMRQLLVSNRTSETVTSSHEVTQPGWP